MSGRAALAGDPAPGRIYFLAAGDVLKGRVEPVLWMRTCEGLAAAGLDVTLVSTYYYRRENIGRGEIFAHYGMTGGFRVVILPTPASKRLSAVGWLRASYAVAFACYLLPVCLSSPPPAFYSKNQICMRVVRLLERVLGRSFVKVFETHSVAPGAGNETLLPAMDLVVVNSDVVREKVRALGVAAERIVRVYNAPFTQGQPLEQAVARARLGIQAPRRILMYVGKLYEENVAFFIETARRLAGSELEVHVVGGNPAILRSAERAKAALGLDNIRFHGFVPPAQVIVYTSAADFLFCSFADDYPLIEQATPSKYFDYMYAGRPFFCSRNTAIRELLRDGENCVFFAPEDAADLVARLSEYAPREEALARMVANNRALLASLGWPRRMERILTGLRGVLAGAPGPAAR